MYNDRLPVPSAFDAFPAYAGKRGLGIYRRLVEVTAHTLSLLKTGGAGMSCKVYVDGALLAIHIGTYTPFEVAVPASAGGRRELVVVTDNRYDFERCPLHEDFFDFYNYGGIIRQVWLEELPANPVANVHVTTDCISTGTIQVRVAFRGEPVPFRHALDEGEMLDAPGPEFTAVKL
ncbi:MAG TPA: hypothetical protein DCR55_17345 [Lentisphaeria bacterium]|nr:hypothetical protein [Lentisphaeria bacterium]